MTIDIEPDLANQAWYYTRLMFSRGRPGNLQLRDGRLTFVTAHEGTATSTWYENESDPDTTLVDVALGELDEITYNWLIGAVTLRQGKQRHILSFVGPPSGGQAKDVMSLVGALTTLRRWRTVLDQELDPREH